MEWLKQKNRPGAATNGCLPVCLLLFDRILINPLSAFLLFWAFCCRSLDACRR